MLTAAYTEAINQCGIAQIVPFNQTRIVSQSLVNVIVYAAVYTEANDTHGCVC